MAHIFNGIKLHAGCYSNYISNVRLTITNYGTDIVFDGSQLDIQLSEQLSQIMRFQQSISTRYTPIYIMAFPDIPRIKERVAKISKGLDKLEILRVWVNNFNELKVDGPKELIRKWVNLF